jgi:hypothetical protein
MIDGPDAAPFASSWQPMTLLLRRPRDQARVGRLNPDLWADDDYAIRS